MTQLIQVIFESDKWNHGKRELDDEIKKRMNMVLERMKMRAANAAIRRITTTGEATGPDTYNPNPQRYIRSLFVVPARRTSNNNYSFDGSIGASHKWAEAIEKGTTPHEIAPTYGTTLVFWTQDGRMVITHNPVMHPGSKAKYILRDSTKNFQRDMDNAMKNINIEM